MTIKKKKDAVNVTFPEYCDLAHIEKDRDRVRKMDKADTIEVSLGKVKEFDTSYLQMLISMHTTFSEKNMIVTRNLTEESKEIFSLYGLETIITH